MKRASVVILMVILASLDGAAVGHEQAMFDRDDSPGSLDLAAVRQKHRRLHEASSHGGRSRSVTEVHLRLLTYDGWKRSLLEGKGNFISFEFDLDADKRIERCLVVKDGVEELIGRLYRHCYADRVLITSASVVRPNRRSVRTAVDRHRLARRATSYRWRVVTSLDASADDRCAGSDARARGRHGDCVDKTRWRRHSFARR